MHAESSGESYEPRGRIGGSWFLSFGRQRNMSTAVAKPPEMRPQALEANPLARELASAFHSLVEYEKEQYRRTAPEALAKAQEPYHPNYEERVLRGPPEEVSWLDLELLAEKNPA